MSPLLLLTGTVIQLNLIILDYLKSGTRGSVRMERVETRITQNFKDDGSFFMEYDDFLKHFQAVDECEFYRDQSRVWMEDYASTARPALFWKKLQ
ncbi:2255_t:CDS:2 [Ambispora leptoticha]|uniref:2255_t:CDS:1 n=1 Tax=Ambispora leptoticha TaxID=144679 RepID=A0A9N9C601_9GLOM|nr:2255_t:CDS:2 [Ambispora leptoticha]